MSGTPAEMELFLQALDLEGEDRRALLEAVEDAVLRQRVQALLDANDELGDRDPMSVAQQPADRSSRLIGKTVDGYRIVSELGRGGMGVVYDAEQLEPRRPVALKTLPLAHADAASERRLEREAETLARLSHVGIAQVFGSGRAAELDGLPYLVMERIDGLPVDAFAHQHHLDAQARLALLASICEALGHAHQRDVIHRDLKPSNVLVTGDGQPKVLDFGIARLLDEETIHTLQTRTGQVIGTLAYMPPEQLTGHRDVTPDARIDVYALGVLGYELLSGRLPVDLPDAPLASAIRQLAEAEPRPLGQVVPSLRGDVEVVLGKALDRDPGRRYGDANALASDLRRILANEPVHARPPSTIYQLSKFVRRHRALCAAVAAVIASLGAGLAWALAERAAARESQQAAETTARREQERAESMSRVVNMLGRVVTSTTPQNNNGAEYTLEESVDMLAAKVDELYADDSYVLSTAHTTLARTMQQRNRLDQARHHLQRAHEELARSELATPYDHRFLAYLDAVMLHRDGDLDAAEAAFEKALAMESEDSDLGRILQEWIAHGLAGTLVTARRDLDRAEQIARDLLEQQRADDRTVLTDLDLLARVLEGQGRLQESIEAWDEYLRELGSLPTHVDSLSMAKALQNQALVLKEVGENDRAVAQLRESLRIRRLVLGDEPHTDTAYALDNLGCVLRDLGQREEALELFAEAEQLFRTIHGGPHLDLAICLSEQAVALRDSGQVEPSAERLAEAAEMFETLGGRPKPQHAAVLEQIALLDHESTPIPDRVAAAHRAVAMREAVHGADHFVVSRALEARAYISFVANDAQQAFDDAVRVRELRMPVYGEKDWRTFASAWIEWIGLARSGKLEEALDLNTRAIAASRGTFETNQRLQLYERHRKEIQAALAKQRDSVDEGDAAKQGDPPGQEEPAQNGETPKPAGSEPPPRRGK